MVDPKTHKCMTSDFIRRCGLAGIVTSSISPVASKAMGQARYIGWCLVTLETNLGYQETRAAIFIAALARTTQLPISLLRSASPRSQMPDSDS